MKKLPDRQYLLERFDYNPETGVVIRRIGPNAGKRAGSLERSNGYQVKIKGENFKLHRVIWMIMTGEDPGEVVIDHIDQDRTNNKWTNLRKTSRTINGLNSKTAKGYWKTKHGKYRASIRIKGKSVNLGTFNTPEEAQDVYEKAKSNYINEHCG